MELRQLRYFVTVAEELHFTRAAKKLHLAQPALSRQIQNLEAELGVSLLERNNRCVRLTRAGEAFCKEARALLEQTQRVLQSARHPSQSGTLSIGYVWGLFHSEVPQLLQKFRAKNPGVSIDLLDLSAAKQCEALQQEKLDAGFVGFWHELDSTSLARQQVGRCSFLLVLPEHHFAARKRVVDLKILSDEVFLLISDQHFPGASRIIQEACQAAGFQPRTLQTAERGHTILSLVAARCGVALLPEPLRALPHSGVVFRQVSLPVAADLYLAWKTPAHSDALRAFLRSVGTELAEL